MDTTYSARMNPTANFTFIVLLTLLIDFSVFEHNRPVTKFWEIQVMCHHEHRRLKLVHRLSERFDDDEPGFTIDVSRGFIGKD